MGPRRQPRASFEPIPPNLDVEALVESTEKFDRVVTIHCDSIDEQGIDNFEKLVHLHVVLGGKPLVVEGYQERLERWTFSLQWLKDNHGKKTENARNLTNKSNLPLTIRHYLNNMPILTNQWTESNYKDANRQRIYLKDIDCPPVWQQKLSDLLPPFLFYLNESTAAGTENIARAGDLMSSLSPEMRAENLMCYIGHEGTYTPSHREMCATLGHNIMVETSTGTSEDGSLTKPGSSIWFMTESKDRHLVSEYWRSRLGHDIEIEDHFAQINAWKFAPFKTYIHEQKVGDLILIPALAPHQVWNRGTRTMKVAWNRTTVETLDMALNEALPKARMVCRDEQYKNKAIIYYTLQKYSDLLQKAGTRRSPKIRQLQKDFRKLFSQYTNILLSETFSRDLSEPKNVEFLPFTSNVTCSYCRGNIFNRFLTCPSCIGKLADGDDDNYDVCMECYSIGRSCACVSKLRWVEQFRWKELTKNHELWRNQIIQFQINSNEPLEPLLVAKERLSKKTLAEICQTELKRRPWNDITKPAAPVEVNEDVEVNADGHVRKRRRIRRSEKFKKEHGSCHICKTPESKWKLASCSSCGVEYCYGSLYRAFDISPRTVIEDPNWTCPKCRKICSCGACRRDPKMQPFEPTGTSLGHDTRKVADPRSVESLVDFSQSNITWIIKAGDHADGPNETRRLKKLEEATRAENDDPVLDDHDIDHDEADGVGLHEHENHHPIDSTPGPTSSSAETAENGVPIDPALTSGFVQQQVEFIVPSNAIFREDMASRYEVTEGITFEYFDQDGPGTNTTANNANGSILPGQSQSPNNIASPESSLGSANHTPSSVLNQADILPIDPNLDPRLSGRKHTRSDDDVDFTPNLAPLYYSGDSTVVTRKRKARVTYTEDLGAVSDQEEPGNLPDSTRSRQTTQKDTTRSPMVASNSESNVEEAPNSELRTSPDDDHRQNEDSVEESSDSETSSSPEPMTQAEENKKAKLMAMQWAEGNTDYMDDFF